MTTLRTLLALLLVTSLAACDSGGDGGGMDDTTPPAATSASSTGSSVSISFSEAVDPASVSPTAFSISPSVPVVSAVAAGASVTLTLGSTLDDDEARTYTVVYNGIRDMAGNAASGTTTFSYGGGGSSGNSTDAVGAAYPNAGDRRLVFINTDGDRFLLFNPVTGTTTDADDLDDLENNTPPLDKIGAAANLFGDDETYFFSDDGDTFTNYERDNATYDTPASFEEEYDNDGYDLDSIGAAAEGDFFARNSIVLFNQNGTQWQLWQPENDSFSDVFTFPAQFGGGNSPISAVGAAVFIDESNELYLFNRSGTQYTIWRGGNNFSAAFPIDQLGDIDF